MIDLHCRTKSLALIYIKTYQTAVALLYLLCLFLKWKEQVLLKSPVKKSTHSAHIRYCQDSQLSKSDLWLIRCCDHTIGRIFIEEYLDRISQFDSVRNLFLWKKNTLLVTSKIYSKIYQLYYRKYLFYS